MLVGACRLLIVSSAWKAAYDTQPLVGFRRNGVFVFLGEVASAGSAVHAVLHSTLKHLLLHDAFLMRKIEIMQILLALKLVFDLTIRAMNRHQSPGFAVAAFRITVSRIAHMILFLRFKLGLGNVTTPLYSSRQGLTQPSLKHRNLVCALWRKPDQLGAGALQLTAPL